MLVNRMIAGVLCCLLICLSAALRAAPPEKRFVRTADGLIVYPDIRLSGNVRAVRLQVIGASIIRVTASPTAKIAATQSLITVPFTLNQAWTLVKKSDRVMIQAPAVTATVLLSTGAVSFADKAGRPIVTERQYSGRLLSPAIFEGQNTYGISQTFETSPGEAYYGLGQHQDDQFNYAGGQVLLFQNNTEVAVPFLVSSRNYGILWDNYSLTKVGDVRDYLPLSALRLFSKNGEEGWLTASYNNKRANPDETGFTRAESEIAYQYLEDSKKGLLREFDAQNGVVTWEGWISSPAKGGHQFRFTYAGYAKVWIDGKLQLDRWRQAWNPGSAVLKLDLEKNKKYAVKIQWIPDGSESYLTAKWLPPAPGADAATYTFASEAGRQLDYYFIGGNNADEVISGYRTLTGKATIVPKWAMGFWQSRERYKTETEILATVDSFRRRRIPLDNIVLDWSYWREAEWGSQDFDPSRFASPDSMVNILHKKYNTRIMISVWPKFYEGIPAYEDFNKKGWLYKRNIADRQRDWIAKGYTSTFYDAFNWEARKGFWELIHKKLYTKGFDAFWMDASEPDILSNVSPQKRKAQMTPTALGTAAEYLNAYPLQNAKGIYEGWRAADGDKRVFLLTRSGFAGSQRYAASIWSGDIASRWSDMKAQISAGLNFSLSGLPFWTMDAGGFSVERRYEHPSAADLDEWRELNTRWYQFAAFVPLFRVHGQFPYREMYNIAPEGHPAYKSMLFYDRLRYRFLPYLYTLAGMTYHKDYTIMRGLVMDFLKDTAVLNIGDQYMFGPSLLVAPVYTYKDRSRSLYLPAGQGWYDLYSGRYERGGKRLTVEAPYERMPVFVKEGSIIPFGPELQYTAEKGADTLTLYVYTGRDGFFTLYEDEDTNYNYEKGHFANIPFTYNEAKKQLTVGTRKGSFPGMPNNRIFNIVEVSKNKPKTLDFTAVPDTAISYTGKAVIVQFKD